MSMNKVFKAFSRFHITFRVNFKDFFGNNVNIREKIVTTNLISEPCEAVIMKNLREAAITSRC